MAWLQLEFKGFPNQIIQKNLINVTFRSFFSELIVFKNIEISHIDTTQKDKNAILGFVDLICGWPYYILLIHFEIIKSENMKFPKLLKRSGR